MIVFVSQCVCLSLRLSACLYLAVLLSLPSKQTVALPSSLALIDTAPRPGLSHQRGSLCNVSPRNCRVEQSAEYPSRHIVCQISSLLRHYRHYARPTHIKCAWYDPQSPSLWPRFSRKHSVMAWMQLAPVALFQWYKYYGVIVIDLLVVGR